MKRKIFSPSNIFACLSFIVALFFVIFYAVNISSEGYFQGVVAPILLPFAIIALVADLLIFVLGLLNVGGVGGKVLDIVVAILKVAVPMLLVFAALTLMQTRIEGLGYIYFSNVDVAKEVQTPANLASASLAITTVSTGVTAAVLSIVGAFFLPRREEKVAA